MTPLRILERPDLREPTMITAFAGWSDAGAASTAAANYLVDRWRATLIGEMDADQFYDFTQLRPTVRYIDGNYRRIEWPENSFYFHQTAERDLIVLTGIEPHLHWKMYVNAVLQVIDEFKVSMVVNLGALNVDFPHTRPVRITGMAPSEEMMDRAGLIRRGGRYEGPTGISGVLSTMLREREMPLAWLWAHVPHYINATPNPAASLALLRSLGSMLNLEIPLGRMIRAAAAFDSQLNEATSKNAEVLEYVRALEERVDSELGGLEEPTGELPPTETIVKDIEEFLRKKPPEGP
jgi:proteasome assembly chaperone (PAC2) family protein